MNTKSDKKPRELSAVEIAHVSDSGEETRQGGGLPKPIFSNKLPPAPLPIFIDLP
jgi:hypothetical protein